MYVHTHPHGAVRIEKQLNKRNTEHHKNHTGAPQKIK